MVLRDEIIYLITKRALFAHALVEKWSIRGGRFLSGFALGALTDEQLTRLTTEAYNRRGTYARKDIFDWEREWFEQDLPPPPARILVGGAGSGREVRYLISKGYRVVAFDPAENYVKNELKKGLPEGWEAFYVGSYQDIYESEVASNAEFRRQIFRSSPYDAVIMGWGSLIHVPDESNRVNLFKQFSRLVEGPVLASFWARRKVGDPPPRSKASQAGELLANRIGKARPGDFGDGVQGTSGFTHSFTEEELAGLAEQAGFFIKEWWDGLHYPHVTFIPVRLSS